MTRPSEWLTKWIYYLAVALYFLAVLLRTWLIARGGPYLLPAVTQLLLWLFLFASEPFISRRVRFYFPIYIIIQTCLVFSLLSFPGIPDFMAALFGVLSMQVMLKLPARVGAVWIVLCTVLLGFLLWTEYQDEAVALTLIYTVGMVFLGSYTRTIRQAHEARRHNQQLADELGRANRRLEDYSTHLEQFSAARERNRLARELHDSVTQTVFSMNLTSQSAALLLQRDPSSVGEQIERLYTLARSALAEMQVLINELKPEPHDGLPAALRRLLADNRFSDSLSVDITIEGGATLEPSVQIGLVRIVQEALNNIVKHARTDQAAIRLHLDEPAWLEIEDCGQGFDLAQAQSGGRVGLASMCERAAEIGWKLHINSSPGTGTRIRVEKPS